MSGAALGFSGQCIFVPVNKILLSRKLPTNVETSRKVRQIRSSIEEIGLIEPLSVTAPMKEAQTYLLLDGHIRLLVLKELAVGEAPCLIAKDDETYTYNSRINRLSTIQEHLMIRRAIDRGVSADRLARALNLDVTQIDKKARLLDGICTEVQELLKDRVFSPELARFLRKMKSLRQIECVELMIAANNLTLTYANAMLIATPPEQLVDGAKVTKPGGGVTREQMAKLENEMTSVQSQYKSVEQTYGQDVLNLVLARGYLVRILGNSAVVKYLMQRQPDVLREFESIVKTAALD